MRQVERELDRCLTLLRDKIREQGFTQLEVQEALGWGRSYISQLLTRQKNLRIDQVVMIMNVIGVEPAEFFGELFGFGKPSRFSSMSPAAPRQSVSLQQELKELEMMLQGLMGLLVEKRIVASSDLMAAVEQAGRSNDSQTP